MKRFFAGLCASLLAATLLGLGVSWSAWHVLSRPDYIKQTLRSSGIYQTFADDIIKQNGATAISSGQLPADQPQVQALIKQSLSPDLVQAQTEQVVDNTFDFIQGKTTTLNTSLNLDGAKQQLADKMAAYTTDHLKSLPTCTAATMPATTVDALQATCLPPGFDIAAAAGQARSNVLNGSFLQDTSVDANKVNVGNGQTLQDKLQNGSTLYDKIMWSVYIQVILAGVLAVGLVLLSSSWRLGMRRVGVIALWTGLVNAGIAWLFGAAIHYAGNKLVQTNGGAQAALQKNVLKIAETVADDIRTWWLWFGLASVVVGVGLLVAYWLTKPKVDKQAATLAREAGVKTTRNASAAPGSSPGGKTPSVPESVKKPRPPRLIQ